MRAPISVVIPTLNAEKALERSLPAVFEGVQAGLIYELIVTDGGSTDATLKIANDIGAEIITGPPSRGGQLQRGVAAARADWVLVLHADTRLPTGWTDLVAEHLKTRHPAVFRLKFDASGMAPSLVAAWANLRTRAFNLPYGDQGLLIPRRLYQSAGGYPDIPLMEDVALIRALPAKPTLLPLHVTTSADRYERDGWMRRGARNLGTLLRYVAGASPDKLAKRYDR